MFACSITNLKYWGCSEAIITRTLQLLNDLSVGYSSVRKLVKLDAVQFMLDNHRVCARPSVYFLCLVLLSPLVNVSIIIKKNVCTLQLSTIKAKVNP